ncbi:MAG: hypothetical protein IJH83_05905 [Coriobacteriales bacterium]|nr:hypothetical protein [Coriobacteriales bacterium]
MTDQVQYDYDGLRRAATEEVTDRNCPQCGGVMLFSPELGMLKCPYCDSVKPIPKPTVEVESGIPGIPGGSGISTLRLVIDDKPREIALDLSDTALTANQDWGVAKKRIVCKNCGAEAIYDELQHADKCPYCGSNQVMRTDSPNTMAPNGVVPFSISIQEAAAKFKSWLKGKFFTPTKAKQSVNPDAFHGVYLPYWTFDAKTYSSYTARYGRDFTWQDEDGNLHTRTDWYATSGTFSCAFDDELVAASTQHNEGFLRGVAPFDTNNAKVYQPEYLAGFAAERYSVGLKDGWRVAMNSMYGKVQSLIETKIRRENNADHVANLSVHMDLSGVTYKYLLLPLWISSFTYNGKLYQFMVNGQTGKVSGTAPVSGLRVALVILAVMLFFLLIFVGMGGGSY